MTPVSIHRDLPRAQYLAERAFATLDRFLHIEAVSGVILLVVAAFAPIWANSPFAHRCQNLWHLPRSVGLDDFVYSQSLHCGINDDVGNSPARLPPRLQQKERPS